MLQIKPIVWIVSQMSLSIRGLLTILYCQSFKAVCSHEKKCGVLRRHSYKEILNGIEISFSTWNKVTTYFCPLFKLSIVCLRGRVMSACSLGLRNAYNKLETLTALHLKWFQMLKQTAEKRTDGSPLPPLILKEAIFKKKIIFRVFRHFPKYRDNFSQDHTNVCINAKLNTF